MFAPEPFGHPPIHQNVTAHALPLPAVVGYLKRLGASLGAYQLANILAKVIGVVMLPLYTRYLSPGDYGTIELLANGVILISILVRLGMIEAFLRYYFSDTDAERRDALVRRAVVFLLISTTIVSIVLLVFAAPLSEIVLGHRSPGIFRVAVLGLWSFTNLELAYQLLRVDERLRLYVTASVTNVVLTVAATITLVIGLHKGPEGYLLGNYGVTTLILFWLWFKLRGRLAVAPGRIHERRAVLGADAVRPADGAGRGVGLPAVDHRPLLPLPPPQPGAGRDLLDRDQARRRGRVHRQRVSVRVAAAGLLGHRRRRGRPSLRTGDDLLPAGLRLRRRRADAARPLGRAAAGGAVVLRRLQGAAVAGAGLGALRPVGGVPDDRRTGEGHDPQLSGGAPRA